MYYDYVMKHNETTYKSVKLAVNYAYMVEYQFIV
jgi:hypothetical protein